VSRAASVAPDEYPEGLADNWEKTRADIVAMWVEVRRRPWPSPGNIPFINEKIAEGLAALDAGERERGRQAMWAIYNLLNNIFRTYS
jgi:hypothetical protein